MPHHKAQALCEYPKPSKVKAGRRKEFPAPAIPAPPPLPPSPLHHLHKSSYLAPSSSSIYVIGNDTTTINRQQPTRLSWTNMRLSVNECEDSHKDPISVASSPRTTRSNISAVSTTTAGVGTTGVPVVGTTAYPCYRTSTIRGSSNTLNDIISDYHSNEARSTDCQYSTNGGTLPQSAKSQLHKHHMSSASSFTMVNGSTVKLLSANDEKTNQQKKCSIFRGLLFCICLNLTYSNVVRFPRELDRHGSTYLIPYSILLVLVGLPVVLLEISMGQFLGQSAAHTWRSSPIFKGACIISRAASWMSTIWISLQGVLALAYASMFMFGSFPFRGCAGNVTIPTLKDRYMVTGNSGQECLQATFLTPFWGNPLFFGLLSIALVCLWIIITICTHNSKVLRRGLFGFGLVGFTLLCTLTGWEIRSSVARAYFPNFWTFESNLLLNSGLWFDALMQVLFATNCGFGALTMMTGKFMYKGDAVRTSIIYLSFNLLINALSVTLFIVQFERSAKGSNQIDELKPLTAIYDRLLYDFEDKYTLLNKIFPSMIYILLIIACVVSVTIVIYTVTRLVPRHPNYVVGLLGLVVSIISLSVPKFAVARLLDSRVVGTLSITALVFELLAVTWVYGVKNIYTDLEFSIGRPICKIWMWLWCFCPALLTTLLVWWCSDDDQFDFLPVYMPRWAPILLALAVIFIIACVQIFRQVEYNFFDMICEASKPAKEWGPADPLARHSWKQWRSVCQDTGRRDFTLRRRGTRDYTHSIKKGQYVDANTDKYAQAHAHAQQHNTQQFIWKSSTPGNSSPNYSGSMFGDSAIEDDLSMDKFSGVANQHQHPSQQQQIIQFHVRSGNQQSSMRPPRTPRGQQRLALAAVAALQQQQQKAQEKSQTLQSTHIKANNRNDNNDAKSHQQLTQSHPEVVYISRPSSKDTLHHATRIEIAPSQESVANSDAFVKRSASASNLIQPLNGHNLRSASGISSSNSSCAKLPPLNLNKNDEHICWRKFSVNVRDYSTEL